MADPTAANVTAASEVIEMHENKERRDDDKVISSKTVSTESGDESGGDSDPLARLPSHYRKEIEAQATVKTRTTSFKVADVYQMEILTTGTFPFRRTAREITDALWKCYGRRFWSCFPANDNHLRIRICTTLYVANI
jgi:hypothetical protein